MDIPPLIVSAGPVQVRWTTLFAVLGVLAAIALARRWVAIGGRVQAPILLIGVILVAGITTGRIAVLLERPEVLRRGVGLAFILSQGGLSIPAAALGGLAVLVAWALVRRLSFGALLDGAAPALLAGEAIALIGVLVGGELAAQIWTGPLGIVYTRPDTAVPATLLGRTLLPLAAFASVWAIAALLLVWIRRPSSPLGEAGGIALIAFGLSHWLIGYFRLDPIWFFGLRQDQAIGCVIAAIAVLGVIFGRRPVRVIRSRIAPGGAPP